MTFFSFHVYILATTSLVYHFVVFGSVFHVLFSHNVSMVSFVAFSPKTATMLMQLLVNQLEPLTEQQVVGICNLQQLSQQAEDALSQGMDALQQSLAETLASGTLATSGSSGNVANYMGQMAMAMGKLGTLEGFLRQVIYLYSKLELFLCTNLELITGDHLQVPKFNKWKKLFQIK